MQVKANNREQQAAHFDVAPPFVPGADILRHTGFKYQYILKDVLIAQTVADLRIASGDRVLDVGSGIGVLLDRIGSTYKTSSFGVDVSQESLKRGREESPIGIEAALSDARRLPYADNSIDLAVSLDVLEHIDSPSQVINEIVRVLRPNGRFLCYAVSRRNKFTFNWFLTAALDRLRVDHWVWSCHHPDLLVDPGEVQRNLRAAGCTVDIYEPFHAFFTILVDQALMVLYVGAAKARLFHRVGTKNRRLAYRLLRITSSFCRKTLDTLQRWDSLWTERELSNGFLILATKQTISSRIANPSERPVRPSEAELNATSGVLAGSNQPHIARTLEFYSEGRPSLPLTDQRMFSGRNSSG